MPKLDNILAKYKKFPFPNTDLQQYRPETILDCLENNQSIHTLELHGYFLSSDSAIKVSDVLTKNSNIQAMILDGYSPIPLIQRKFKNDILVEDPLLLTLEYLHESSVRILKVNNYPFCSITLDKFIEIIINSNLEVIDLSCCRNIKDDKINIIIDKVSNLKTLNKFVLPDSTLGKSSIDEKKLLDNEIEVLYGSRPVTAYIQSNCNDEDTTNTESTYFYDLYCKLFSKVDTTNEEENSDRTFKI